MVLRCSYLGWIPLGFPNEQNGLALGLFNEYCLFVIGHIKVNWDGQLQYEALGKILFYIKITAHSSW